MATNTQYFKTSLSGILSQDYGFIFEALDHLRKGNCCSNGEEICTWDLLPRISQALHEHIAFEEKWVFPKLSEPLKAGHEQTHSRLLRLLAEASWELECGYGDRLRALVTDIESVLNEHLKYEALASDKVLKDFENLVIPDENLQKIEARNRAPWSA